MHIIILLEMCLTECAWRVIHSAEYFNSKLWGCGVCKCHVHLVQVQGMRLLNIIKI